MPSSTSSSEVVPYWVEPIAERTAPPIAWGRALVVALLVLAIGVALWEVAMRRQGLTTDDLGDSESFWAAEHRRIGADPAAPIIIGSSRLYFDLDIQLWGRLTGTMPLQLAREGTNPRPVLADLAKDPRVTGLVILGYDPLVFWRSASDGQDLVDKARKQPLYQRSDLILYQQLARVFAYLDSDLKPMGFLERLDVPQRTARGAFNQPWKLSETGVHRTAWMWARVESDRAFRDTAAGIWLLPPPPGRKPVTPAMRQAIITEIAGQVRAIRARGGEVIFVRSPSDRPLLDIEDQRYPRAETWDRLLAATGSPGIYWANDPELARLHTVELSHLGKADREPYTRRLVALIDAALAARGDKVHRLVASPAGAAPMTAAPIDFKGR